MNDTTRAHDVLLLIQPYLRRDVTAAERDTIASDMVAVLCEPLRVLLSSALDALELPLLFHNAGPWDDSKRLRWRQLTNRDEATTRVMCDVIRELSARMIDES